MRPEFKGHNDHTKAADYWFQADNIHPSQPGADAIAAKVWKASRRIASRSERWADREGERGAGALPSAYRRYFSMNPQ